MPAADPKKPSNPIGADHPEKNPEPTAHIPVIRAAGDSHARIRHRVRRLTLDAVLIALALVLSIVERWIPLELIVPVPGIKLGLANIVTLFALLRLSPIDAAAILVTRSLIMGLIIGPTTLFFSLGGGTLALLAMWFLSRWEGRAFSLVGLSIAGAAAHNFGQILVAVLVLTEPLLLQMYLPPLLLTSIVTGALTGIGAYPVVARFPGYRKLPMDEEVSDLRQRGGPRPRGGPMARLLVCGLALTLLLGPLSLAGCKVIGDETSATVATTANSSAAAGPATGSSEGGSATGGSPASGSPATGPTTAGSATTRPDAAQAPVFDGVKYSHEFTGTFDTVIQLIGYATSQAAFDAGARAAESQFRELHQLFDAYHDYPGVRNIKSINDQAGIAPVAVDPRIIALLLNVQQWRATLTPLVDVTIGPVVALWAEYREKAAADPEHGMPPPQERLASALLLTGAEDVVIDQTAGTVFLKRAGMRLDVGAVAKGYATELVAQSLAGQGARSLIINAGGSSVRLIGKPEAPQRSTWNIAIQNPEYLVPSQEYVGGQPPQTLTVIRATGTSIVTSGDYHRYYQVEDQIYHHLINPETGQPAGHYRAVTVVVRDSGIADFLSTALFLLPPDAGKALVARLPEVEALWAYADGHVELSDGLKAMADPIAENPPIPAAGPGATCPLDGPTDDTSDAMPDAASDAMPDAAPDSQASESPAAPSTASSDLPADPGAGPGGR